MVFQRPVMLRRSALANVAYALELAGVAGAERARSARAALESVGLAHLAHRPARVLSGGEQQRLALARAWALHPEVLFLDEPTASLDPSATREIEAVIRAIRRRRHQDRHDHAQPRPGAAPGRRGPLPAPGARWSSARRSTASSPQPATPEAAAFIKGELPWV